MRQQQRSRAPPRRLAAASSQKGPAELRPSPWTGLYKAKPLPASTAPCRTWKGVRRGAPWSQTPATACVRWPASVCRPLIPETCSRARSSKAIFAYLRLHGWAAACCTQGRAGGCCSRRGKPADSSKPSKHSPVRLHHSVHAANHLQPRQQRIAVKAAERGTAGRAGTARGWAACDLGAAKPPAQPRAR